MKKTIALIFSLLSLSSCVVADADPKAAYTMFKEGKAVIFDVREADEVSSGIIEGAVWFPLSKIQNDKNWKDEFVQQTKGKNIFLYCRSGRRSGTVKDILKESGIESGNIGGFETLKSQLPVKIPST